MSLVSFVQHMTPSRYIIWPHCKLLYIWFQYTICFYSMNNGIANKYFNGLFGNISRQNENQTFVNYDSWVTMFFKFVKHSMLIVHTQWIKYSHSILGKNMKQVGRLSTAFMQYRISSEHSYWHPCWYSSVHQNVFCRDAPFHTIGISEWMLLQYACLCVRENAKYFTCETYLNMSSTITFNIPWNYSILLADEGHTK